MNNDGTIYDPPFNHTWMRCSLGQTWNGFTCAGDAKTYSWYQAKTEATKLQFAGKNDWRLPTSEELSSLVYCRSGIRSLESGACGGSYMVPTILSSIFPSTQGRFYWTSSSDASNSSNAKGVIFHNGYVNYNSRSSLYHVRLVRDGK